MEGTITTGTPPREHRLFWWKELLIVAAFYVVYSWIRNQFGSNTIAADGVPEAAFHNAERIIRLERAIGLYHEETLQDVFLPYEWFIQFWNVYYGTAHFFVTLGVFILLFFKRADVFPQWRNTLAAMTALAIVGFAFFPLMPPRLLDAPCPIATEFPDDLADIDAGLASPVVIPDAANTNFGGACVPSQLRPGTEQRFDGTNGFGFTDTIKEFGGPWRFDSDRVAAISNQYAAMPSMHIGWSTWCAIAVWPLLRRRRTKALVLTYPAATLFCIIVTGNHFWLDGVGGLLAFAVGAFIGWWMHRWNQRRLDRLHGLGAEHDLSIAGVAHDILDDVASTGDTRERVESSAPTRSDDASPNSDPGSPPPDPPTEPA